VRRVREDFAMGEIIDLDEPGWENTNPVKRQISGSRTRTRYEERKTMVLTRWEKDLETTENDPPEKDAAFPREYRFYSLGNTQDFVHIR